MKNTRIIMALLMLLGAASLAEAQIVVSQTTASTTRIHEKSGRKKGVVIRPEIAWGFGKGRSSVDYGEYEYEMDFYGKINLISLYCNFDYQFNPYFTLGAGTGLLTSTYTDYLYDNWYRGLSLPLCANARAYFCDRKWSPFFDIKIGYNIPLKRSPNSLDGMHLTCMLGLQFKRFDIGLFASWLKGSFRVYSDNTNDFLLIKSMNKVFGIDVAYNIPFK